MKQQTWVSCVDVVRCKVVQRPPGVSYSPAFTDGIEVKLVMPKIYNVVSHNELSYHYAGKFIYVSHIFYQLLSLVLLDSFITCVVDIFSSRQWTHLSVDINFVYYIYGTLQHFIRFIKIPIISYVLNLANQLLTVESNGRGNGNISLTCK